MCGEGVGGVCCVGGGVECVVREWVVCVVCYVGGGMECVVRAWVLCVVWVAEWSVW